MAKAFHSNKENQARTAWFFYLITNVLNVGYNSAMSYLERIKDLKARINQRRPLNTGELRELQKWYRVSMTYHSNALEGSTLTENETKLIIEEGITIGGKTVRELKEALNHATLVDELFLIASGKESITEKLVNSWHGILLRDIDSENAGRYRKVSISVTGSEEVFPASSHVPKLMGEFYAWLEQPSGCSPVALAAAAHWKFVKIHPFIDGNGRVARLMMNLILMKEGYPPVIIPIIRRGDYLLNLRKDEQAFENFIAEMTFENMKDYCRMLEIPLV